MCDYSTQVSEIRTPTCENSVVSDVDAKIYTAATKNVRPSRMRALLQGSGFLEVGATLRRSKLYTGSYKRCFIAACRDVYVASMAAQRGCKLAGKERACKVLLCLPVRGLCFRGILAKPLVSGTAA